MKLNVFSAVPIMSEPKREKENVFMKSSAHFTQCKTIERVLNYFSVGLSQKLHVCSPELNMDSSRELGPPLKLKHTVSCSVSIQTEGKCSVALVLNTLTKMLNFQFGDLM